MITFAKQNRLLVLIVALFVFIVLYYTLFAKSSEEELILASAPSTTTRSQELLTVLADLQTIELAGALFQDPTFLSLSDYGVILAPQPVGRRNPFAPPEGNASAQQTRISVPSISRPAQTPAPTR